MTCFSCDITAVVDKFVNISRKYNCTPLQLELLCAVAKLENAELLDRILKETEAVHGPGAAQVGLVSALAENGQANALRNTLIVESFNKHFINISIKRLHFRILLLM